MLFITLVFGKYYFTIMSKVSEYLKGNFLTLRRFSEALEELNDCSRDWYEIDNSDYTPNDHDMSEDTDDLEWRFCSSMREVDIGQVLTKEADMTEGTVVEYIDWSLASDAFQPKYSILRYSNQRISVRTLSSKNAYI